MSIKAATRMSAGGKRENVYKRKAIKPRMTAEQRRKAIMAAAEQVFAEKGYHETTVEIVAGVADVSKALIYQHFPTKRDLYQALLATSGDELLARVEASGARTGSREERLRGGIEDFFEFVVQHPGAARLLFCNATDPDVVGELDRVREEAAAMIADLMTEEVPPSRAEDPIPVEVALAMLAHQLIGALQALAVWWLDNPDTNRNAVVRMAMESVWIGLDRLSAGERWTG
ncbi:MAG TPA: TetR/AcrR family transcriptional regulator [Solirubrobacterales bacterium]|nr:TetR/AcrR family transcriptional regulator [Solirubrobacterales bacterium]